MIFLFANTFLFGFKVEERKFISDISQDENYKTAHKKSVALFQDPTTPSSPSSSKNGAKKSKNVVGNFDMEDVVKQNMEAALRLAFAYFKDDLDQINNLKTENKELKNNLTDSQSCYLKEVTAMRAAGLEGLEDVNVSFYDAASFLSEKEKDLVALIVKDKLAQAIFSNREF